MIVVRSNLTRIKSFNHASEFGGFDDVLPGINQYSAEAFDRLKAIPDFEAEVAAGNFKIVEGTEQAADQDTQSLEKFSAAEAKTIVAETENTDLLRAWEKSETRKSVAAAIKDKLASIDAERNS